jgi:O-antigen/teichoic acid export membrane protein
MGNALYRGSLILLANTVLVSAIGVGFWTLAARAYPASEVGVFSSLVSGVGLLGAIAALGLPNTMIRHIASAENPRALLIIAVMSIVTVGTALCLLAELVLGPHLPAVLHLRQHGRMMVLLIALVVITAVSSTFDAGLIATRSSHAVLGKNLIGSIVKLGLLYLLVGLRAYGLLDSYFLGLTLATVLSGIALSRRIRAKQRGSGSIRSVRRYLSIAPGNYLATILGILPTSIVPIEVLVVRGASDTARFAIAFLIAGFLNLIPSTVAQVLFAEASRQGVPLGGQLRNALRGVYGLLVPAVATVVVAAPLMLRVFGAAYSSTATGCLRVLGLSALLTGGTYLVDSVLIARDRIVAYVFINGANAAFVLGLVRMLLPHGLTAAAGGWALAQGLSLLLGLILLATGMTGRHHSRVGLALSEQEPGHPMGSGRVGNTPTVEGQIRTLLSLRPTMPTTLIAEHIGWDEPIEVLLGRVTELRPGYMDLQQPLARIRQPSQAVAQCGFWFPPIEIPVGSGQTRSPRQLPVLIMVTSQPQSISAILLPTRHSADLFAGLWELFRGINAVPAHLSWASKRNLRCWEPGIAGVTTQCRDFCGLVGTGCLLAETADTDARDSIEMARVVLEHCFLPGRRFGSPKDFNNQLRGWLAPTGTPPEPLTGRSSTQVNGADIKALLSLPQVPPPIGWKFSVKVGSMPGVRFDSNTYSLPPAVIGHNVKIAADLTRVRAACNGKLVASHERAWTRELMVGDLPPADSPSRGPRDPAWRQG